MNLLELNGKLRDLLITDELTPYLDQDAFYNGLLVSGREEVKRIGFGVSANLRTFQQGVENNCDLILTHHGLMLGKKGFDQLIHNRLKYLFQEDISLWVGHFVLDAHPVFGNNAQILKTLGIEESTPYIDFSGAPWGRLGKFDEPVAFNEVLARIHPHLSPQTTVYNFGNETVQKIAVVSGKGAPTADANDWLMQNNVDLYITGEVHEWNQEESREYGLNLIGGGHYHTEMFGVKAVQKHVEQEWGLETMWLDVENPI